jgi:hypothetical protein
MSNTPLSNTPYVQSVISYKNPLNPHDPRPTRTKEVFIVQSEKDIAPIKLAKARKLTWLSEVLNAKASRDSTCYDNTISVIIKRTCSDEIATLNREIILLRSELNNINDILPLSDKFSETENSIVNPRRYGGRKCIINSIKNSKTKHKSHRKNRLSKSHSRRRSYSRKLKR